MDQSSGDKVPQPRAPELPPSGYATPPVTAGSYTQRRADHLMQRLREQRAQRESEKRHKLMSD